MTKKVILSFCMLHIMLLLSTGAVHSQVALIVHEVDGSSPKSFTPDDIRRLTFSDVNLSLLMRDGSSSAFAFDNVKKLTFGVAGTGIDSPKENRFDVIAYVTRQGEVIVQSPGAILSLTTLSVDGRVISVERYSGGAETQCIVSLQNAPNGIYLLRIETEQGITIKKIIKK